MRSYTQNIVEQSFQQLFVDTFQQKARAQRLQDRPLLSISIRGLRTHTN